MRRLTRRAGAAPLGAETTGARPATAERLAAAEAWIAGHEARCEERHAALCAAVAGLEAVLNGWRKGVWALVLAVLGLAVTIIGSLLVQIYALEPLRAAALAPAPPAATSVR